MNDEEKGAIDEIANALEMINRLSSRLRQGSASRRNKRQKIRRVLRFAVQ